MDKCVAAGGSSMWLDGPRTDREALGGIQAAGSFRRMDDTWRHREACVEAKRRREGGVGVGSNFKCSDEIAPPTGVYLSLGARGSCVIFRA